LLEGRPLALRMTPADEDIVMYTDRHKVQQIVINLLGNAAKFTERGQITVGYALAERPGWTDPPPSGGPWARIWVRDTGIGIAEDDLDEIFAEFRQLDGSPSRRYGGAGLGLTISKKLAKLLEGDILVESKLGVGSMFAVVIPVRHPSTQPLMRGETLHEMPAAKLGEEASAEATPANPEEGDSGSDEETNPDR
jgi:signal transduction histidine kinase